MVRLKKQQEKPKKSKSEQNEQVTICTNWTRNEFSHDRYVLISYEVKPVSITGTGCYVRLSYYRSVIAILSGKTFQTCRKVRWLFCELKLITWNNRNSTLFRPLDRWKANIRLNFWHCVHLPLNNGNLRYINISKCRYVRFVSQNVSSFWTILATKRSHEKSNVGARRNGKVDGNFLIHFYFYVLKWDLEEKSQHCPNNKSYTILTFHGNLWTHNRPAPNVSGFIAHGWLEHRTSIAKSRVETPMKSFFQASLRNCVNCFHNR